MEKIFFFEILGLDSQTLLLLKVGFISFLFYI